MYIEKYDKHYKHNYKPIIDKWLFDKCQSIRQNRTEQGNKAKGPQISKKEFIFADIVTCAISGRKVTCDDPEDKSGKKRIYLISKKYQKIKIIKIKNTTMFIQKKKMF